MQGRNILTQREEVQAMRISLLRSEDLTAGRGKMEVLKEAAEALSVVTTVQVLKKANDRVQY